jgi:hypothetical protein
MLNPKIFSGLGYGKFHRIDRSLVEHLSQPRRYSAASEPLAPGIATTKFRISWFDWDRLQENWLGGFKQNCGGPRKHVSPFFPNSSQIFLIFPKKNRLLDHNLGTSMTSKLSPERFHHRSCSHSRRMVFGSTGPPPQPQPAVLPVDISISESLTIASNYIYIMVIHVYLIVHVYIYNI